MKWKIKAENDLKIAEKDLASEDPVTDAICFHAQQAAEKYLKMFLVSHGKIPTKSHVIHELLENCRDISSDFNQLQDTEYLTEYAVSLRYPDTFYIPSVEEAKTALNDAKRIRDFVLEKIQ